MKSSPGSDFSITFLGGASSIGASCLLVEAGSTRLLIDCGVRLNSSSPLPDLSLLGTKPVDAIIVTHAHFDHTGALPLVADTFIGAPVIASPPTADLTAILLRDAVKLMGGPDQERDIPLYTRNQVEKCIDRFVPLPHCQSRGIGDLEATLFPASHILGASMVYLATPAGTILFTGDYSVEAQRTVPALEKPPLHVDCIVSESTYGRRLHEDRKAAENRLVERITAVIGLGGKILIPAFAIGRAQEVILILKQALRSGALPSVPVYVDGMVKSVCAVYGSYETYVTRTLARSIARDEHPFFTNGIVPVVSPADRGEVLRKGPCVIVASSGMLSGGASAAYAPSIAEDERSAILITGYQDEESPGRMLLDAAEANGPREVRIGGQNVSVRCTIEKYGLSAHADRMQMVGFIESLAPRCVALVHGDEESRASLAKGLTCRDVVVPAEGATMVRSFLFRQKGASLSSWSDLAAVIDIGRARHILGPPGDAPLPAGKVALAWFGKNMPAAAIHALVDALERERLVRRDDRRRSMLWVLSPSESGRFPDEAGLEEELKKENPKGRLLEWCMRRRIPLPATIFTTQGQWHTAEIDLAVESEVIRSGPCRASERKTAEQLAARAILDRLAKGDAAANDCVVDERSADALKRNNAKGRLLEFCAQRKLSDPRFDERPVVGGFSVMVAVEAGSRELTSKWYRAASAILGEQAAAAEVVAALESLHSGPAATGGSHAPDDSADHGGRPVSADGRPALNFLRQQGVLKDFGYTVSHSDGPAHRPRFTMIGWATTPDGRRFESEPVIAESKKDGALLCATALFTVLKGNGIAG